MLKKIFFACCLAVEIAAFAFFVLTVLSGVVGKEDALIAVACLLTTLLLATISLSCLVKCWRNKEKLVGHALLMKLSVFLVCMSVSFLAFEDGWIATLVFLTDLGVLYSPHYLTDRDGIRQSIVPRRLYIRTKDKKIWVQFFFIVEVWD